MRRRASGEALDNRTVIEAHPHLMPELGRELELLTLIERARSTAITRSRAGPWIAGAAPNGGADSGPPGYDLVREVHRGGQGIVYDAVQRATGRRVAVKVRLNTLGLGVDTVGVDRFEREVEILAQLEHAGIVRIIDSGILDGRPFYVMDFVDGAPLDEFLAAHPLEIRPSLALFEKIATSVAAAHVRGVIHRDIKPANILIEQRDGAIEPRLVDFGLARLHQAGQDALGGRTIEGQFLGSVPWASPEQAAGDPARMDVRSDVYALGVVLFQMLTGSLPYRLPSIAGGEGSGGLREALGVIASVAPARPSSLRKGLDPDIDTITLKCLAKEPERRYQSAAELAADIRRYLDNRPIVARPPSLVYQLRRFARRNRVLVGAAAAVCLALAVGAVATVSETRRALAAERHAAEQLQQAERRGYIASLYAADAAIRAGDGPAAIERLEASPTAHRDWEWRYLMSQADASRTALDTGEPVGFVRALGVTGRIASLDRAGMLRAADARTGEVAWQVSTVPTAVAMAASGDGSRIVVLNNQRWMVVDGRDGTVVHADNVGDQPTIGVAALSADGSRLYLAGRDTFGVRALNASTGQTIAQTGPLPVHIRGLAASTDGASVASVESPDLVIRDAESLAERRRCPLGSRRFGGHSRVAVSPDSRIAAVSRIENILLFRLADGAPVGELKGHRRFIKDLQFNPADGLLVSAAEDASVREWNIDGRECVRVLTGHREEISSVCKDPASGCIWSCAPAEPAPRVFDPAAGHASRVLDTPPQTNVLNFDDRSGEVLLASPSGIQSLGLLDDPEPSLRTIRADGPATDRHTSAGRRTVATRAADGTTTLHDLTTGEQTSFHFAESDHLRAVDNQASRVVFGKTVHDLDDRLWVTDGSGARLCLITVPGGGAGVVEFGNDPDTLVTSGYDFAVRVWKIADGRERHVLLEPHASRRVITMAPDPARNLFVTTDSTGAVIWWDLASGREVLRTAAGAPIYSLGFSSDGVRLAAGGEDGNVRIINPANGDLLLTLRAVDSFVEHVVFSRDGRWLLCQSHEGSVVAWDSAQASDARADAQSQPSKNAPR